jgi:hypothetical protein
MLLDNDTSPRYDPDPISVRLLELRGWHKVGDAETRADTKETSPVVNRESNRPGIEHE